MKINKGKLKPRNGYLEGKSDAIDKTSITKALEYKKEFLKKFIAIAPQQIDSRLGDAVYWATRKYDGEYAEIFYENGVAVTVNRSGRIRTGLPCTDEVVELMQNNGITQAVIPAEIYVYEEKRKTRVNDLINALANQKKIDKLRLACYDIIELNGKEWKPKNYGETLEKLDHIFSGGTLVHSVDWQIAKSNARVKEVFHDWVEVQGSEGLVVRSEMPFVWKIKPRHNVDAVVIGFTEGTGEARGQVRTMLLALMPEEGRYQIITKVGGGMTEKQKRELYGYFSHRIIKSEYVQTDSNHVAFQMVKPDRVIEFSVNDVRWESPSGIIQNTVLEISEGVWRVVSEVNGISFVAPIIERFRDDKRADAEDVRLSQVESFSSFEPEEVEKIEMPKMHPSQVLFREVYKKQIGDKIMVFKLMGWKTNKEKTGDWTSFVLYTTNFSTQRQQRLQREVDITDDYGQLQQLRVRTRDENVKKGWERISIEEFDVPLHER